MHLAGSFEIVERVMRQKMFDISGFSKVMFDYCEQKPNILFSEPNILFGSEGLQQ